jgi:hypothetical protein
MVLMQHEKGGPFRIRPWRQAGGGIRYILNQHCFGARWRSRCWGQAVAKAAVANRPRSHCRIRATWPVQAATKRRCGMHKIESRLVWVATQIA